MADRDPRWALRRKRRARLKERLVEALGDLSSAYSRPVAYLAVAFEGSAAAHVITDGSITEEDIEAIVERAYQRGRADGPDPWDPLLELNVPPELLTTTPAGKIPTPEVLQVAVKALVERAAERGDPAWGTRILGRLISRWMPVFEISRYKVILWAIEALGDQVRAMKPWAPR